MRTSLLSFLVAVLVLSASPHVRAQTSTFTVNLSLGSHTSQVITLQQLLNRDPATRIASTGPGSPGNETNYFGSLTKAAVLRFQEKYTNEVLAPVGLTQGNGYVGSYTRAKLNILSATMPSTGSVSTLAVPAVSTPPAVTATTVPASPSVSQNPNLKNIDKFMTALDTIAAKQHISAATLVTIKEQVMQRLSTTTDLRATFLKQIPNNSHQSIRSESPIRKVLATIEQAFATVFIPKHAYAQTATVPFGGALLEAIPCDGGIWLITIEPLPPSFVALLSYMSGEQAFLSYNIPLTSWLLGEYAPGPGLCIMGEVPIPSEGVISPETGSSPL